jgi:hypothetical protein
MISDQFGEYLPVKINRLAVLGLDILDAGLRELLDQLLVQRRDLRRQPLGLGIELSPCLGLLRVLRD